MTSKNLSLTEKLKNHRKYVSRTLWTSFIALPLMAAYNILMLIIFLSRSVNYARVYKQSAELLYHEKLRAVSSIMGMENLGWILTTIIAVMFAFQGFSYLFNQSQLDFYLSQPTTRRNRVTRNLLISISTYLIMDIFTKILGLIVAAAYGAVNGPLLLMVSIELVRNLVFFIAVYSVTVLAMMLSGTMPMAVLLTMFFFFITTVIGGEILGLKRIFFDTVSYRESIKVIASPFYDRVAVLGGFADLVKMDDYLLNCESIFRFFDVSQRRDLDTFLVALISLILVGVASRGRKSEWAGKTIVYRPFRWVVKIVACVVVGLGTGIIVKEIYAMVWNTRIYVMMFVLMLLATLASCIFAEIILQGDIKAFAKGKGQTVIALSLVALVFVIFRGDLLGYDSYLPAASRLESCALLEGYNSEMQLFIGNRDYYEDYSEENMYLTNIDDVLKLAKLGMKAQNEAGNIQKNNEDTYITGYDFTVLYRFKDGREVYRNILIPKDVDPALMDSVFSGKEYLEGYFAVFNDEAFRQEDKLNTRRELTYRVNIEEYTEKIESYDELSDALRKDISANYGFAKTRDKLPIGQISYQINTDSYGSLDINIYDTYTNTIELLKKYGLYHENNITPDMIKRIEVTDYYPGYDVESFQTGDAVPDTESYTVTYEDSKDIKRILEASIMTEYYGTWYDYDELTSDKYYISAYLTDKGNNDSYISYTFKKGQVPDFVIADTNK